VKLQPKAHIPRIALSFSLGCVPELKDNEPFLGYQKSSQHFDLGPVCNAHAQIVFCTDWPT
jgi:hypothetical protein